MVFVAGDLLASGGQDGHLRLWDVSDTQRHGTRSRTCLSATTSQTWPTTRRADCSPRPDQSRASGGLQLREQLKPAPRLARANGTRGGRRLLTRREDARSGNRRADLPLEDVRSEAAEEAGRGSPRFSASHLPATTRSSRAAGTTASLSGTLHTVGFSALLGLTPAMSGASRSARTGRSPRAARTRTSSCGRSTAVTRSPRQSADSLSVDVWDLAVGAGGLVAAANADAGTSLWRLRRPSSTGRSREPSRDDPCRGRVVRRGLQRDDLGRLGRRLGRALGDRAGLPTAPREPCRRGDESVDDSVNALAFSRNG